jgi:two-component system CheB/CheR fusion protein
LARSTVRRLKDMRFPVVAIGASAGGLEAVSKLLEAVPLSSGMAFVVVQHLDPPQGKK